MGRTACHAVEMMAAGEMQCEEFVSAYIARIVEREPVIRAFAHCDCERALHEARKRDLWIGNGRPARPLHGIPVGVKDVFATRDMPTSYNSPIYAGHYPKEDAACVRRLREAGAIIIGKTVTSEFAHSVLGPTRNPHNQAFSPGGSSSGSAAAVAADFVPLALGSQTGGSTIRPASYCGTFALKPTFGALSTAGMKALAPTFDTVGLFAQSLDDLALLFSVLGGPVRADRASGSTFRIGVCRPFSWGHVETAMQEAVDEAADQIAALGYRVADTKLPDQFQNLPALASALIEAELAVALRHEYSRYREHLNPVVVRAIEAGLTFPARARAEGFAVQATCRRCLDGIFREFDALLTFSAPGPAPPGRENGSASFNAPWTLLGVPCLNIPWAIAGGGLPIGVQMIASPGGDVRLLDWATTAFGPANRVVAS